MARKRGYSPMQHVFGCDLRMPGVVDETSLVVPGARQYHAGDSCVGSNERRLAARKAFLEMDEKDKVRRAMSHRSRDTAESEVGQIVYYWRPQREGEARGSWKGPARVIGFHQNSRIWVAHGEQSLTMCTSTTERRYTRTRSSSSLCACGGSGQEG